jgi:hypothetical protein
MHDSSRITPLSCLFSSFNTPGRSDKDIYMVAATGETMPRLIETAKALRQVRRMQTQFLLRWSLERARQNRLAGLHECGVRPDPIADPGNRDWRLLYRGDVLDD